MFVPEVTVSITPITKLLQTLRTLERTFADMNCVSVAHEAMLGLEYLINQK